MADAQELDPLLLPPALTPRDYIVSVKHGDDTVLLNVATGRYYTLNVTGSAVWQWLCRNIAPEEIVGKLAELYEIDLSQARASVVSLLRECSAASLFQEEWQC